MRALTISLTILLLHFALFSEGQTSQPIGSDTTDGEQTYAIIIGISNYKFIRPLTYADKDAELFRDFLKSKGGGNLPEDNIFCLLNDEAKAANFWIKGMNWLRSKKMKKGDRLYVYMAGHGDAINQDEYFFLTYDCNPAGDKNNYIVTGNIQLYNLKSRIGEFTRNGIEVYLIMDACRSNELPGGSDGQQILNSAISEKATGEVIMLATGAGQESYEDGSVGSGHGLFTYYLVDGLSGYADKEGNSDNTISLKEIQTYVTKNVPVIAETKYNKKQNPFISVLDSNKKVTHVDSAFFTRWGMVKNLKNIMGSEIEAMSRSVAARGVADGFSDSVFTFNYAHFKKALKQINLTGTDSSAEYYYSLLLKQDPTSPYTKDARLSLAAEYVNFAQTKINLYLHGKDEVTIQQMRMQIDDKENTDEINTSFDRMERIAQQDFTKTGSMLEKAISYLDVADSTIVKQLKSKVFFFKAHGYFDKGNRNLDYAEAMRLARNAYFTDPHAAYIANTLSTLFLQTKSYDSALYYASQAADLAPLWRLPYLNKAYAFNRLTRKDSALFYYQKAIATDQGNADAYTDMGRFYYNIRQVDSAVYYYEQALKLDPNNLYAHNNMGWIMKEQRKYPQAIQHFKTTVQINDRFFNSYNGLSKIFSELKQYDSARYYYRKALEQSPDKLLTTNYLGNFYKEQKMYDSAMVYYKQAISYDEKDNIPLINIGNLYASLKQTDSAIKYLNDAVIINPSDHKAFNQLGLLYKEQKKWDSSLLFFNKAYSVNNYYGSAVNNIGLTYLEQKAYDSALHYYQKAVALEPDNAALYNNIGVTYKDMRKTDAAKAYFNKAISINPLITSAYTNMGWLLREQRKYDSAKLYFKEAVVHNPGNKDVFNQLMNLFKYINQYDSVRIYYMEHIKADPTNVSFLNNLGVFYFEGKGYDSAISLYKRAVQIDPLYATGYNNLGTVYNEIAFYDSAIYFFKKAVALEPDYTNAYFNLGMAFHNRGKYDSAIVHISKAITLAPANNYFDYFLACAYALKKKPVECLQHLNIALQKGYKDYYTILHDADLKSIRSTPEYMALVKEHVPEKFIRQVQEEEKAAIEALKKEAEEKSLKKKN